MLYMWGKNPQSYSSNSLCSLISFYLEYLDDTFHMEISMESGSSWKSMLPKIRLY